MTNSRNHNILATSILLFVMTLSGATQEQIRFNILDDVSGKPIEGAEKVAIFMNNLRKLAPAQFSMRVESANGLPSLLLYSGDIVLSIITFAVRDGRITQFQNILNPDKLKGMPRSV